MDENYRQFIHAFFSFLLIVFFLIFGQILTSYFLILVLVAFLFLAHFKALRFQIPFVDELLDLLERDRHYPFKGAILYLIGALLLVCFVPEKSLVLVSLSCIGFGDAASTIFGRLGKTRIWWSKKKTFIGSLFFFLFSLPLAILFKGISSLPLVFILAFAESFDFIDDNIFLPVVVILLWALKVI